MVNSLLAIMLVVRSSRGSHFVFHYPKVPRRRNETEQFRRENDLEEEFGEDLLEDDVITWPYGLAEDFGRSLRPRLEDEEYDFNLKNLANNDTGNYEIERNERSETSELLGFNTSLLAEMFCPRKRSPQKFQLSIDDLTFVGQPIRVADGNDELQEMSAQTLPDVTSGHGQQLNFFHLVFVLEPPELELCRQVDDMYNNIVTKLTAALRYEQLRCDYIGKEAELMLSLRENSGISTLDELMAIAMEKSSLARTIRSVYDAISTDSVAHTLINEYIDLSLQIPSLVPNPSNNNMTEHEYAHYPVIAPYHTLLLLEDPEEILKNTPLDANPTLIRLVQILTPTQRLADLCSALDCSMAQIFRLAAHLIYWRKAKLIDTVNLRNNYVVSPTADMSLLPTHIEHFKQHFPNLDLIEILDFTKKQLPPHRGQRLMYLEAITYLLRKDFIVQLHQYVLVTIPHEEGLKNPENNEDRSIDIIPSSFERASESEREWLNKLVANQQREIVPLFERLIKYFNGRHHVDEILFRENLRNKDLFKVFNLFNKDQIILFHC